MVPSLGELILIGFILGFIAGIFKDRKFETALIYGVAGAIILPIIFYIVSFLLILLLVIVAIIIVLVVIGYFVKWFSR